MRINSQKKLRYQRNIVKLYNDTTIDSIISGKLWYREAHNICQEFSERFNVPLDKVCQVMAILSPATSWQNNKNSTEKMLYAFSQGRDIMSFKVSTYGQNKVKAWRVLHNDYQLIKKDTGLKIYSFYQNMLNPDNEGHVTIDRHAIKVLEGDSKAGSRDISPKQYREAEHVYAITAPLFGLKPHELQAVLWVTYKEKVGR